MIARYWRGYTRFENAGAYLDHLEAHTLHKLNHIDGFIDARVLRNDREEDVEFVVLTTWTSMASIEQFAGEDANVAVVPPEARAVLSEYDASVIHYEVVVNL